MSPFDENLAKLSVAAKKLNTKTEDLSRLIGSVEATLAASQLGLTVWLETILSRGAARETTDQNGKPIGNRYECDAWLLGYDKVEDAWHVATKRILVRADQQMSGTHREEERLDLGEAIPLLKAPRSVRVEATPYLEGLVVLLTSRAEYLSQEVDKAEKSFAKDSPQPTEMDRRVAVALKGAALPAQRIQGTPEHSEHTKAAMRESLAQFMVPKPVDESGESFLGVQAAQDAARREHLTIPHPSVAAIERAAEEGGFFGAPAKAPLAVPVIRKGRK